LPVVNIAPSATRDVPIRPLIKLKPIEGNALLTDWDFRDVRSDLRIEAISVHAKVIWRVPQSQKAWSNIGKGLRHSGRSTKVDAGSIGIQHPATLAGIKFRRFSGSLAAPGTPGVYSRPTPG
jgi:hypothetical protein